jgi:hypothetical protein
MKRIKDTFLNCEKATLLAVKNQECPLGFKEQLILKFHLSLCDACQNFVTQSKLISNFLNQFPTNFSKKMSETKKNELQELIDQNS